MARGLYGPESPGWAAAHERHLQPPDLPEQPEPELEIEPAPCAVARCPHCGFRVAVAVASSERDAAVDARSCFEDEHDLARCERIGREEHR